MKRSLIIVFALCLLLCGSGLAGDPTTLTELRQGIDNNFMQSGDVLRPDSLKDDFINDACREVAGYDVIHYVDSIVWVANTKYYTLPVDFLDFDPRVGDALYPIGITGERAFDFIPGSVIGKIGASAQLSTPEYFWIMPKDGIKDTVRMGFYPVPTAVDTVIMIYSAEAVVLSGANDTTNIPYRYTGLVIAYATALCYANNQELNKGAYWFSFYDQMLNRKLAFEQKRFDYFSKPRVIGD